MRPLSGIVIFFFILAVGVGPGSAAESPSESSRTAAPSPQIFVEQQTECMTVRDIKDAIGDALHAREEAEYMIVTVVVTRAVEGNVAVLRIIERETGEILLERRLAVTDDECRDAPRVFGVMVAQFLTSFPIESWQAKRAPTPSPAAPERETVIVERDATPLRFQLHLGAAGRWPTPSGDVELGLGMDAGGNRHGVYGRVLGRVGWPGTLEEGRYIEGNALVALGWRFSPKKSFRLETELRTGALLVKGFGYEKNYRHWLVMLELDIALMVKVGPLFLGPTLSVAPLFHDAVTASGERELLPWLRIGARLSIPTGKISLR